MGKLASGNVPRDGKSETPQPTPKKAATKTRVNRARARRVGHFERVSLPWHARLSYNATAEAKIDALEKALREFIERDELASDFMVTPRVQSWRWLAQDLPLWRNRIHEDCIEILAEHLDNVDFDAFGFWVLAPAPSLRETARASIVVRWRGIFNINEGRGNMFALRPIDAIRFARACAMLSRDKAMRRAVDEAARAWALGRDAVTLRDIGTKTAFYLFRMGFCVTSLGPIQREVGWELRWSGPLCTFEPKDVP